MNARNELELSERNQIQHIFPFQFFYRSKMFNSVDDLIATQIGNTDFKLALWSDLGKDNGDAKNRRILISDKIRKGLFQYENDPLLTDNDDRKVAGWLHLARNNFVEGESNKIHTYYGSQLVGHTESYPLLEQGIKYICTLTEEDFLIDMTDISSKQMDNVVFSEKGGQNMIGRALELISLINRLRQNGLKIDNRSHIRSRVSEFESTDFRTLANNDILFEGVLEIFDCLYNSTIAKASSAHSESIISARNSSENLYITVAEALANKAKNALTDFSELPDKDSDRTWIQGINIAMDRDLSLGDRMIFSMPWDLIWRAYLDEKWIISAEELNEKYYQWDKLINNSTDSIDHAITVENDLNMAYEHHMENVIRILDGSSWTFYREKTKYAKYFSLISSVDKLLGVGTIAAMAIDQVKPDLSMGNWIQYMTGLSFLGTATLQKVAHQDAQGCIRKTFKKML